MPRDLEQERMGTKYLLSLFPDPCSGTSHDWYAGVIGTRFAYTLELRDQGYGFLLPAEQIIPSGEETLAMYQVMLEKIIEVSKEN